MKIQNFSIASNSFDTRYVLCCDFHSVHSGDEMTGWNTLRCQRQLEMYGHRTDIVKYKKKERKLNVGSFSDWSYIRHRIVYYGLGEYSTVIGCRVWITFSYPDTSGAPQVVPVKLPVYCSKRMCYIMYLKWVALASAGCKRFDTLINLKKSEYFMYWHKLSSFKASSLVTHKLQEEACTQGCSTL